MGQGDPLDEVRATCESLVRGRGLDLVDLTLRHEGEGRILRLIVEDPEGPVDLEALTEISQEVSRALDAEDPIEGTYTLEVSSPGIERPLVRPQDYERFAGRMIKVKTFEPIDGRRNFAGRIEGTDADGFDLALETERFRIPFEAVSKAKLMVDWEEELKKAGLDAGAGRSHRHGR